jgi:hypothetical protein
MNPSEDDRSRSTPNVVERDQKLLEELVSSVALIGGVIAYLVLVIGFAS